jgi:uncharacterized protein YlxP (DUF503 family)
VVVGVLTWQLHLPQSRSLKDKRQVLRSLKDRLRARFNVSAAETDHQELWQRAALTVAVVSTERAHAEQVLRAADRIVAEASGALVLDATAAWL